MIFRHKNHQLDQLLQRCSLERYAAGKSQAACQQVVQPTRGNIITGVDADYRQSTLDGGMDQLALGGCSGDIFLRFEDQGVMGDEERERAWKGEEGETTFAFFIKTFIRFMKKFGCAKIGVKNN